MNLPVQKSSPSVVVNEIFGPTLQGEGPDIGRPCLFLRFQHCPVNCPGCDTAYTWNGKEQGTRMTWDEVTDRLIGLRGDPTDRVGLVVSGGEPLLHYRDTRLVGLAKWFRDSAWSGLETSGYLGDVKSHQVFSNLASFCWSFSHVVVSPKITPCLHGRQTDEEAERLIPTLIGEIGIACLKFVVRDQADVEAVERFQDRHQVSGRGTPIYIMPYGNDRDEILRSVEQLIPAAAEHGWIITPRLHALLWGAKRGV